MKVFGIGLQRTGLTSLTGALNQLGIKSVQCPKPLFEDLHHDIIREYDGFIDNPVQLLYKELDRAYPDSKFVFTTRDEAGWLESVKWLFTTGAIKFKEAKEQFDPFHERLYGTTEFDAQKFSDTFRRYTRDVKDYFAERHDDLLMLNIKDEDAFERLCRFLDRPVPAKGHFPHRNKREGILKVRWQRLIRRVRV